LKVGLSGDNDKAFTRLIRKAYGIGRRLAAVDVQAQLFATAEGDWSQPRLMQSRYPLLNEQNVLLDLFPTTFFKPAIWWQHKSPTKDARPVVSALIIHTNSRRL